jgi:hypothetical protein
METEIKGIYSPTCRCGAASRWEWDEAAYVVGHGVLQLGPDFRGLRIVAGCSCLSDHARHWAYPEVLVQRGTDCLDRSYNARRLAGRVQASRDEAWREVWLVPTGRVITSRGLIGAALPAVKQSITALRSEPVLTSGLSAEDWGL